MKIPFTTEQFFTVFEHYNQSVFPVQLILILLGIWVSYRIHSGKKAHKKQVDFLMAVLWIWSGLVYHIVNFSAINKAAIVFGSLYILQGLLFLFVATKEQTTDAINQKGIKGYLGYFFLVFGLLLYPIIGFLLEQTPERIISLGLPCPTTLFTLGILILRSPKIPWYLLIIPCLWSLIGLSAAINFGVFQDYMMIIGAVIVCVFQRKKTGESN
jgi:hypothetical protein